MEANGATEILHTCIHPSIYTYINGCRGNPRWMYIRIKPLGRVSPEGFVANSGEHATGGVRNGGQRSERDAMYVFISICICVYIYTLCVYISTYTPHLTTTPRWKFRRALNWLCLKWRPMGRQRCRRSTRPTSTLGYSDICIYIHIYVCEDIFTYTPHLTTTPRRKLQILGKHTAGGVRDGGQ